MLGKRYNVQCESTILVLKFQIHMKHFANIPNIPQFESGGIKNILNGIMNR